MGPKDLNKEWECEHGCNQSYYIKKHESYCPHLEKIITPNRYKGHKRSVDIVFTDKLERFESQIVPQLTEDGHYDKIVELTEKLQNYRLTEDEETAILGKLAHNKSYADIALEIGCSRTWAYMIYKRALEKLRTQGFK
jgi:DNA-directed RNA polymerase specialized sigma24 family protein